MVAKVSPSFVIFQKVFERLRFQLLVDIAKLETHVPQASLTSTKYSEQAGQCPWKCSTKKKGTMSKKRRTTKIPTITKNKRKQLKPQKPKVEDQEAAIKYIAETEIYSVTMGHLSSSLTHNRRHLMISGQSSRVSPIFQPDLSGPAQFLNTF